MVSSREGLDQLPCANVYIYAVKDEALAEVVAQVKGKERAMHLHTSGSMPISVFGDDKPHAGIFYPFQTFSKARLIEDFSTVPIFFEARGIDDISAVYSLALSITSHVYETTQHDRERLHVAGVFTNNFTNLMYTMAAELLQNTHIPFKALLPLIDETAKKIHTLAPRDAQTGPARRGDENVMRHHLSLLGNEQQKVYQLLSEEILRRNH
jgi:predicted short-subunit dehydrogenase-like oxidoreductase (DUF2520 family)